MPPRNTAASSSGGDSPPVTPGGPSSTVAGFASLFVLVHFFCVFVVMSANYSPSPLQARLVRVLAPYTQSLNFDLNYTPYHLTHASDQDVDHVIEFAARRDATDEQFQPLLAGWRGGERYKRYQRIATVLSYFRQDAATSSRIGQAVARGVVSHQNEEARVIRCRKHFLMPWDRYSIEANPHADEYQQTVYSANIVRSERGTVDVVKVEAAAEVARPTLQEPAP